MKILYSAYWCNPFRGSEWQAGFKWLEILLERYEVLLFTSTSSEASLLKFYKNNLPSNLRIKTFNDNNIIPRKIREIIHLEYFIYNRNLGHFIEKNPNHNIFRDVDVLLHKNPSSFRYFTCLYKLNKPLIIGPVGGGLQIPHALKKYLKSDSWIRRLRVYDQFIFKIPAYKSQFEKAAHILVSFDYLRNFIPSQYGNKVKTIFDTGIDVNDYLPETKNLLTFPVKILSVGRLILAKGTELTIKALSNMNSTNYHLDIVGDGPERSYLEKLTLDLGLRNQVTFHGNVPYDKVDDFYKEADIFCFPTLKEAGGTVILEAMKFGLPIITVKYGGPEFLCPDSGAFKISVANPKDMVLELSKRIDQLIAAPDLRHTMGKENFKYCKDHFTWTKIKKDLHSFLESYNISKK